MGLGAVHCVVNGSKLKQSQRTTAGAEKWLDVNVWDDTAECLGGFKRAGYQIVTTHLSESSVSIQVRSCSLCMCPVLCVIAAAASSGRAATFVMGSVGAPPL